MYSPKTEFLEIDRCIMAVSQAPQWSFQMDRHRLEVGLEISEVHVPVNVVFD